MAQIRIFGGGQIAGSIGATVYSHNRFGQYARNRSIPVNPNSPAQNEARAALTGAVTAWRNLTSAERALWEQYAAQTPWTNKFGETAFLTGMQQYIRYWTFGSRAGYDEADLLIAPFPGLAGQADIAIWPNEDVILSAAPVVFALQTAASTGTGTAPNTLVIDFGEFNSGGSPTNHLETTLGIVLWGYLRTNTINFHRSPWRVIASYTGQGGDAPSGSETFDLDALFGWQINTNSRLFLQLRYRENDTPNERFRLAPLANTYLDGNTFTVV